MEFEKNCIDITPDSSVIVESRRLLNQEEK